MADMMTFPETVEEFMERYKITDTEQIYTNGAELVPVFRMKQWFEHKPERKSGKWEMKWHRFFKREVPTCSVCKAGNFFKTKFCPNCGAEMRNN